MSKVSSEWSNWSWAATPSCKNLLVVGFDSRGLAAEGLTNGPRQMCLQTLFLGYQTIFFLFFFWGGGVAAPAIDGPSAYDCRRTPY